MSDDPSTSPFQEKADWKGKIKGIFQKKKEDLTGEVERTLTQRIRAQWDTRIAPKFSRMKGLGPDGMPLPSRSGIKFDASSINTFVLIICILITTWILSDLPALYVEKVIPPAPVSSLRNSFRNHQISKPLDDFQVIIKRNLFSSLGKIPGEEAQGLPNQDNEPVRTGLPLNLIGTVILKNELRSVATIEDKTENQVYPMRIDDELPGKIKILSIEPYKVVFRNLQNGLREFVDLPEEIQGPSISVGSLSSRAPSVPIEQTAPNTFNIARSELDKVMSNPAEVLTQARAIPHMENGQPAGWRLVQIVPGSVYEKLGLKNEDVICGVNGESINDPARAMELFSQLKTASQLDLCVKRGGRQNNYNYNFR